MDDKMRDDYDEYLKQHISNVQVGFDWLVKNLPNLFEMYDADALGAIVANHDASKTSDEEYYAYAEYFYSEERTQEVKDDFDLAWLHHQHNNPHHWQHWLLREDDGGLKALQMPYECIIEMICDWWAFSWVKGDLYEIFSWYKSNKPKIQLHELTQQTVEDILDMLRKKLDEVHDGEKQ